MRWRDRSSSLQSRSIRSDLVPAASLVFNGRCLAANLSPSASPSASVKATADVRGAKRSVAVQWRRPCKKVKAFMRKQSWLKLIMDQASHGSCACRHLLFVAGPALPQSPPADGMAAARELLVTMPVPPTSSRPSCRRSCSDLETAPSFRTGREVERDYDAGHAAHCWKAMSARVDEILDQIAEIYARNFTADELREIPPSIAVRSGRSRAERRRHHAGEHA